MKISESLETILYFYHGYPEEYIQKVYRKSLLYKLLDDPKTCRYATLIYCMNLFRLKPFEMKFFINGGIYNEEN